MEINISFESLEYYLGESVVMEFLVTRMANNDSQKLEACKSVVRIIGVTPTAIFIYNGHYYTIEKEHFKSAKRVIKDEVKPCPVCYGRGVVLAEFYDDSAGKGKVDCHSCNGKGYIVL